jgi:ribose transport system ATP-binding protein
MQLCDRITVLRDGRRVATVAKSHTDIDALIRLMTGRTFSERYPRIESKLGRKLLEVRNLTRGSRVRDVSFDLHEGEIIGFAGLVGAGRTDLMQSIFGLERADSGEIVIDGERVVVRKPRDAIRRGFSLLTEDRKNLGILPNMTVRENIVVTLLNLRKGVLGQGLTWLGRILRFSRLEELASRVVRELNVKTPSTRALIVELSGGNQQKTLLGRALSAGARIIILDEPTKGVDAGAKIEIYRMLQSLVDRKLGVIVVSSELPEVMAVAHRIAVMKNGRLTAVLSRDTTSGEEIVRHATT